MTLQFSDVYDIQDRYRRFDQGMNAFNKIGALKKRVTDNTVIVESPKITKLKKQQPGFSLLDYAFRDAAFTVAHYTGSGYGFRNQGLYSWDPLKATNKPDEIPRWSGSPDDAARIVAKAARYYGATHVGYCPLDQRWVYSHDKEGRAFVFDQFLSVVEFLIRAYSSIEFSNIKIKVCLPEDLIIQKAVSTRQKDWLDIRNVIENQRDKMDWNYLLKHCKDLYFK